MDRDDLAVQLRPRYDPLVIPPVQTRSLV